MQILFTFCQTGALVRHLEIGSEARAVLLLLLFLLARKRVELCFVSKPGSSCWLLGCRKAIYRLYVQIYQASHGSGASDCGEGSILILWA